MLDEKQLALRRTGITGTDIGAILGLSEFRSPMDVWRDKTGRSTPEDLTPALKRGIYLEDGILRWYEADTGALKVERCGTIQLAGQPRIMATPDALAMFVDSRVTIPEELGRYPCERRGVEVKAPGPHAESGWGEPGTDQVPQAYLAQAVFEMAVLDVERLDFAALLGGELRIFPVKRNRRVEGHLIERALAFWHDHVEADKAPPPTWRERDAAWIRESFPKATKPSIPWADLTPEQRLVVEEYLRLYCEASEVEKARAEYELRLKMLVGEAGGVYGLPSGIGFTRIDWVANATAPVAWKQVAESLRDGKAWDEALAAARGTPARPFVPRKVRKGAE